MAAIGQQQTLAENMMNNDEMVKAWRQKIFGDCERILQRQLTDVETSFVHSRAGFIALELIEDSISNMNAVELLEYLNSDRDDWWLKGRRIQTKRIFDEQASDAEGWRAF